MEDRGTEGHTAGPPAQAADVAPDPGYDAALQSSLHYLGYRPRSGAEIKRHLEEKGHQADVRQRVLRRLEELELVDDRAFARRWVQNRERFRPRSARALRYELARKGVPAEEIDRALEGFDPVDSAYRALMIRAHAFRSLDPRERRDKCQGYLARRGYPYHAAASAIRRAAMEWDGESPQEEEAAARG